MKIRAYGFLANANKKRALKAIRASLGTHPPPEPPGDESAGTSAERILRLTGIDVARCLQCKGRLAAWPLPPPRRPP